MTYTVKPGDTLSKIARDVLGNMGLWPAIAELNNIQNPDLIFPGQVLILPDKLEPLTPANTPVQQAGLPGWLGWLMLLGIGGGLLYANKNKSKKSLAGVTPKKLTKNQIRKGAKFKTETGIVWVVDDIKNGVVHTSMEHGAKGNYRDPIDDVVEFLNEEKAVVERKTKRK